MLLRVNIAFNGIAILFIVLPIFQSRVRVRGLDQIFYKLRDLKAFKPLQNKPDNSRAFNLQIESTCVRLFHVKHLFVHQVEQSNRNPGFTHKMQCLRVDKPVVAHPLDLFGLDYKDIQKLMCL